MDIPIRKAYQDIVLYNLKTVIQVYTFWFSICLKVYNIYVQTVLFICSNEPFPSVRTLFPVGNKIFSFPVGCSLWSAIFEPLLICIRITGYKSFAYNFHVLCHQFFSSIFQKKIITKYYDFAGICLLQLFV